MSAIAQDNDLVRTSPRMRWAGAAATVGGVAAIAMTLPFATALFLAYPGENALPVWFDSVEPRVDPVITFASRDEVYETYGRIYNVVYLLFLPALVALHRVPCPSPNGLESRGYVVMASGLAATTVGVAGDYWGNGIGFPIEVLGLLAMTIGVTVWGAGLVRGGVVPRLWAWSLLISGPGAVITAIAIAHIPSGPTLSFATAWTVVGVMLLVSQHMDPDESARDFVVQQ